MWIKEVLDKFLELILGLLYPHPQAFFLNIFPHSGQKSTNTLYSPSDVYNRI